jgi:hypothetical protein
MDATSEEITLVALSAVTLFFGSWWVLVLLEDDGGEDETR